VPIVVGVPEYQAVDGRYPPGVALPAAEARLRVADLGESDNIAGQHPDVVENLSRKLEHLREQGRSRQ
jgi:hypothetical protein